MRLKKPKKLRMPKKPRGSATSETLKNWLKRAEETTRRNAQRFRDYEKEIRDRKKLKARVRNF